MIHSLDFKVTFPNGRSISGRHSFDQGMTVIAGRNGQGKSTRLEMIRFALFGSSALRGATSDYEALKVTLTFSVRDEKYSVHRTLKSAEIRAFNSGAILATGQKAVTTKVGELLGYGQAVFDIANSAKQKEIAALSAMQPAERRRMVDQVVGLDILEQLEKWCAGEARALDRLVAELEPRLPTRTPEPPAPASTRTLEEIDAARAEITSWMQRVAKVEAFLATPVKEPTQPAAPDVVGTIEETEQLERDRLVAVQHLASLDRQIAGIPDPTLTQEEIDHARAYVATSKFLAAAAAEPAHPRTFLENEQETWDRWDQYQRWQKLHATGHHHCPACHHEWPIEADALTSLPDFHDTSLVPAQPTLSRAQISAMLRQWSLFESEKDARDEARRVMEGGEPKKGDIPSAEKALRLAPEKARLVTEREALKPVAEGVDRSADLKLLRAYHEALRAYVTQHTDWANWMTEAKAQQLLLDSLKLNPHSAEDLVALAQERDALVSYQLAHAAWTKVQEDWVTLATEIAAKQEEAGGYRKAQEALRNLGLMVKNHLLPALNSTTGVLVSKITNGAFQRVEVDETFEVRVEGQPLATLSGSESTAVNLALRIALGQLLTNRVFSVFMGDEVDADMDDERSTQTAEMLRSLTSSIAQVLVVSHKRIDADHYLDV